MRAMILAAGLGTRLRPLTDDRPKALVTVAGKTLLEMTLTRLQRFGVREVIVNAHHFAEMLSDYLAEKKNFGMEIEISREELLLDTGGGLKKAAHFFVNSREPFILHNVDVVSNIDLKKMVEAHVEKEALATLAVQERETTRKLLFDERDELCGRMNAREGMREMVRETEKVVPLGFCGIHVISPEIFKKMEEEGAFSIIDAYLTLAGKGERIIEYRADECYWRDLGKPESIRQTAEEMMRLRV